MAPVSCHCVLLTSRGCQLPVPGLCSPPMFNCSPHVDVLLTLHRIPPCCPSSPSSGLDPSRWGGIEGPWDRQGKAVDWAWRGIGQSPGSSGVRTALHGCPKLGPGGQAFLSPPHLAITWGLSPRKGEGMAAFAVGASSKFPDTCWHPVRTLWIPPSLPSLPPSLPSHPALRTTIMTCRQNGSSRAGKRRGVHYF